MLFLTGLSVAKCSKPRCFEIPFGHPAEFLRGLTCADKQNELSRCTDKQNKHSRFADKLTNKINSADMLELT